MPEQDACPVPPGLPVAGFTTGQMMLDWPGKLAVTVFLKGCNMDCPFCHSWELIRPKPGSPSSSEEAVLELLAEHADFYDGICITGGEPTLHDLSPFIKRVRAMGKGVKLDTNGTRPKALATLIADGLVDYVAMDYKSPEGRMREVCGGSFSPSDVAESKRMLISGSTPHEFRTTLVPAMHKEADVAKMSEELSGARLWFLQRFRGREPGGETVVRPGAEWLLEPERFDDGDLRRILESAKKHVADVRTRGF